MLLLRGDVQQGEKPGELGIVEFVVDDEAGVDGNAPPVVVDLDGGGVTAGPRLGLEQGHIGDAVERPGGSRS